MRDEGRLHSTEAGGLLFIRTIPSETCMNHKVLRERVREGEEGGDDGDVEYDVGGVKGSQKVCMDK